MVLVGCIFYPQIRQCPARLKSHACVGDMTRQRPDHSWDAARISDCDLVGCVGGQILESRARMQMFKEPFR
jgi:hypothetical protein